MASTSRNFKGSGVIMANGGPFERFLIDVVVAEVVGKSSGWVTSGGVANGRVASRAEGVESGESGVSGISTETSGVSRVSTSNSLDSSVWVSLAADSIVSGVSSVVASEATVPGWIETIDAIKLLSGFLILCLSTQNNNGQSHQNQLQNLKII